MYMAMYNEYVDASSHVATTYVWLAMSTHCPAMSLPSFTP
jgi:hypothetical protein